MKAENIQFSKLVRLFPIGDFRPEILASKDKRAFFLGHPVYRTRTKTKFPPIIVGDMAWERGNFQKAILKFS